MKYYNYLLKCNKVRNYIFLFETGTANQGNLGIDALNNILLPKPPIEIQNEIANDIDKETEKLNKVIDLKKQTIEKLKEYKKSLIYEAVTGKIEV